MAIVRQRQKFTQCVNFWNTVFYHCTFHVSIISLYADIIPFLRELMVFHSESDDKLMAHKMV